MDFNIVRRAGVLHGAGLRGTRGVGGGKGNRGRGPLRPPDRDLRRASDADGQVRHGGCGAVPRAPGPGAVPRGKGTSGAAVGAAGVVTPGLLCDLNGQPESRRGGETLVAAARAWPARAHLQGDQNIGKLLQEAAGHRRARGDRRGSGREATLKDLDSGKQERCDGHDRGVSVHAGSLTAEPPDAEPELD